MEGASEGLSSRLPLLLAALHQILEAGFGKESVALGKLHFNLLFLSGDFF